MDSALGTPTSATFIRPSFLPPVLRDLRSSPRSGQDSFKAAGFFFAIIHVPLPVLLVAARNNEEGNITVEIRGRW